MDPTSYVYSMVKLVGKSIIEEAKFLNAVKGEVEEMQIEIQWMQNCIEDADHHVHVQAQSQQQHQSRVFRQWVSQIKEASLDAEDIIDTYMIKLALRKRGGILNYIKKISCMVQQGKDIHIVGLEIEALKSRLSTLRNRLQTYGTIRELRPEAPASSSGGRAQPLQRRSNYAHILDRNVVGLDGKMEEVVDLLLKEQEPCKVVSIYGLGGLGKTTLAKKVYQNKKIRSSFGKFVWVSVSQQFKARDIWESMLTQLTSAGRSRLSDEELAAKLCEVQKENKCFILLDDIWSIQDWNKLSPAFALEEGESKMVITTRKMEVADHVDRRGSYGGLEPLSEEQGMELLRMIAIAGRDDITDKETMEQLIKEMLKHCGGLPLAICVLAGILVTKYSLREWEIVHANIKTYLRKGQGHNEEQGLGVHEVLAYSYYDLPHPLKSCFLYLSQFPEDYEIQTNRLLKMWMAEGFVSVEYDGHEKEVMEDTAERYLNELVGRCMIQVGKEGSTGRIKTCRMHDLMRDMCLSKAKEENMIHSSFVGGENVKAEYWSPRKAFFVSKIRRLSFYLDPNFKVPLFERNSQLRSFILNSNMGLSNRYIYTPELKVNSFMLLKMLVLEGIESRRKNLPKHIGDLVQLRYFSMRNSYLYAFPPLEKLGCLETLDLRGQCTRRSLPNAIWTLRHLRHLYLPETYLAYSFPNVQLGNSNPNMQTLVNFPQKNCDVNDVVKFPNLRRLLLRNQEKVTECGEIFRSKKAEFRCLSSLSIVPNSGSENDTYRKVDLEGILMGCPNLYKLRVVGGIDKVPQVKQWPRKLTKLSLKCSAIEDPKLIGTTIGKLPNLKILCLLYDSFTGEKLCFPEGSFPQLKSLRLVELKQLQKCSVDQGAMSNLQSLEIIRCYNLEMLPEGLRFIATLKNLLIRHMLRDFETRVKEGGSDFYKIQHVPSIEIIRYL